MPAQGQAPRGPAVCISLREPLCPLCPARQRRRADRQPRPAGKRTRAALPLPRSPTRPRTAGCCRSALSKARPCCQAMVTSRWLLVARACSYSSAAIHRARRSAAPNRARLDGHARAHARLLPWPTLRARLCRPAPGGLVLAPTREDKYMARVHSQGCRTGCGVSACGSTSTRVMPGHARGRRRRPPQPLRVGRARDPRAGPRRARRPGDAQRAAASAAGQRAGAARPQRPAARHAPPRRGPERSGLAAAMQWPGQAELHVVDLPAIGLLARHGSYNCLSHEVPQAWPAAPACSCAAVLLRIEPGGVGPLLAAARSRARHDASCGLRACLSCRSLA